MIFQSVTESNEECGSHASSELHKHKETIWMQMEMYRYHQSTYATLCLLFDWRNISNFSKHLYLSLQSCLSIKMNKPLHFAPLVVWTRTRSRTSCTEQTKGEGGSSGVLGQGSSRGHCVQGRAGQDDLRQGLRTCNQLSWDFFLSCWYG